MLTREVEKAAANGKSAKVLNLGCGPALEIQAFLEASPASSNADFTLLDFNDETVGHATRTLEDVKQRFGRETTFRVLKKSVAQLFKEQAKPVPALGNGKYDIIYCAGLFDYLADPVCGRLVDVFYRMLSPGGIVVTTNVDASNPSRGWMEYMVDWHLFYRNSKEMLHIMERTAPTEAIRIFAETSGVNIFAEIRKPADE
jgi:extracellular factor (EF) 3-hydroxypalmitic acid methyl ester biosynthesis protein